MPKVQRKYKKMKSGGAGLGGVRIFGGKYKGSMYAKRTRNKKAFNIVLTGILCVAAVTAGYFLMRVILNRTSVPTDKTIIETESVTEPIESDAETEPDTEQETEEQPVVTDDGNIIGSYADISVLAGGTDLESFIASAKQNGINSIVVEIKNIDGYVRYASQLPDVQANSAILDPVLNIESSIKELKNNKIKVIAKMYCFRDAIASGNMSDMAVHYMNEGYNWLDNSASKGGRPWLNPYSSKAQNYLSDIAKEISELGFDAIILDGVQKPTGYSLDLATYGDESVGVPLSTALGNFVSEVKQKVSEGTEVYVAAFGDGALYGSEELYGGNPAMLGESRYCPDLRYGQYVDVTVAGQYIENASADMSSFIQIYSAALSQLKSDGIEITPIIQGSGDILKAQTDALSAIGITDYIVMN